MTISLKLIIIAYVRFHEMSYFSHDFLNIYDGGKKIDVLTGVIVPTTIRSYTSNMTIQFQSDEVGVKTGVEIDVEFIILGNHTFKCYISWIFFI